MSLSQHNPVAKGAWKPASCLMVLAPIAGELITSSAPPFIFFVPWVFVLFALLYGCGALLVRELAVRWQTGWPGMLLLGAAYGIFEEALGAKSFFDPHWRALGPLGVHGRWMGVNWIWTIGLTLFHSVFCIWLSIQAAGLPFREMRSSRWLGNKVLALVGILYFLVLLLFFQKGNENHYKAPVAYYWASILVACLCIVAARLIPRRDLLLHSAADVPPRYLGWLGFVSTLLFVVILYFVPATGVSAWVTGALLVSLAIGILGLLWKWSQSANCDWSIRHEFNFVSGVVLAWAIQAPLQEWNPARSSSAQGMTLVGLACLGYLLWMKRLLERSSQEILNGGNYAG